MTIFPENIRKVMGWCPSVNSWTYKSDRQVDFAYPPISPKGKRIDVQPFQSGNVIFPANVSLLAICLAICFGIIFNVSRYLDYHVLFMVLFMMSAAMCIIYYIIAVRTFQASILVDENGVHYNSFRFKNITLNYSDIKSVKSIKWDSNNYSRKIWIIDFSSGERRKKALS